MAGPHQMPLVLLQLGLEALKQCECVGCGTGETRQHLAVVELAHLARRALDHDVAQGDLPIAADGHIECLAAVLRRTLMMVVP
jgi:hypothetical protein